MSVSLYKRIFEKLNSICFPDLAMYNTFISYNYVTGRNSSISFIFSKTNFSKI